MPKYLFKGSYTVEGARGVASAGGNARREAVEQLTSSVGGSVEAFYFAFGGADVYVISDLPDDAAAMALSLAVNASGAVGLETIHLVEPEAMDEAARRSVDYRAPGS